MSNTKTLPQNNEYGGTVTVTTNTNFSNKFSGQALSSINKISCNISANKLKSNKQNSNNGKHLIELSNVKNSNLQNNLITNVKLNFNSNSGSAVLSSKPSNQKGMFFVIFINIYR